jgi:hypothetical protein
VASHKSFTNNSLASDTSSHVTRNVVPEIEPFGSRDPCSFKNRIEVRMKKFFFSLLAALSCAAVVGGEKGVYAAHEWGTFTSVQGADGVQMEWNPFTIAELPKFVYDRLRPDHENRNSPMLFLKNAYVARQRMETPVIYFYSPERKTVDVHVDFATGIMTEWFPHATRSDSQVKGSKMSFLEWNGVEIGTGPDKFPVEAGKSHYYAARETEAAPLRIKNETEKFLFYRGVGHFDAPLKITQPGNDSQMVLENAGKEDLKHLMLLKVDGKNYSAINFESLPAGKTQRADLSKTKSITRDEVKAALEKSLASEGLFAAEAKAMVKTWEDSWLDEKGVRVLYVLGREWTDRTLPLTISPQPQEIVRVMVGRAEVITPQVEVAFQKAVYDYLSGDPFARQKAIANYRGMELGRFQDAAFRRVVKNNPSEVFKQGYNNLCNEAAKAPASAPLAFSE